MASGIPVEYQRHVSALMVVTDIYPEIIKVMINNTYPPPSVVTLLSCDFGQKLVKTLTPKQQKLVNAISIDGYRDLDVDLMYKLCRHFGLVTKPSKNWGSKPAPNDVNQGDDVERMRYNRNDIVHRPRLSLTEKENEKFCVESAQIAMRMDIILGNPLNGFQQKIENAQHFTLSFESGNQYLGNCAEYQGKETLNNMRQLNFYIGEDIKLRIESSTNGAELTDCVIYVRDPEMTDIPGIVQLLEEVKHKINEGQCKIKLQSIKEGSLIIQVAVNQRMTRMACLYKEVVMLFHCIFELEYIDKNSGPCIDIVFAESNYTFIEDQSDDIEPVTFEPDVKAIKLLKMNVTVHNSSFQSVQTLHSEVHGFVSSVLNSVNMGTFHQNGSPTEVVITENHNEKEVPSQPVGPLEISDIHKTKARLSWHPSENDGGSPITGYIIETCECWNLFYTEAGKVKPNVTTFELTGLNEGRDYFVQVKAVNIEGQSKPLKAFKAKSPNCNLSNITSDVPVIKQQTKDENLSSQPNNFVTGAMKSASDDPKERQNEENKISEIISNTAERTGHTNKQTRTGYVAAQFSKPEKQGKEYVAAGNSQHVKGKKTKTQKKKDPWDPPSDFKGNVIHYVDVLNIGNDTVIINKGPEKPEEDDEEFEPRYTISVQTMDILKEVSKSVGYIHGFKESGTCWRAGNNKIVTAAHVVKGNIWNSVGKFYNEAELNNIYVNFDYIERSVEKYQTGSTRFKVEPRVIHLDESLDVAVLQLKHDEHHELPKALQMFHKLDPKKDLDKEIFLISHNKGETKGINGKIGIWTPTEKRMAELQTFCEEYGQDNGYLELDRSDRLVIKCDFVGGASGSPGITLLNDTPHVVLIYLRGFPDFYYMTNFSQVKKKKFPQSKLFQQGTCIGSFYDKLSCNLPLRNEIFPLEAELETNNKRHQYAMAGDSSKKSLQISTCSEAHNITAVTNSSYIDSHAGDLLNDPAVVHHTTMRQASCIFLTDTVYDSSNAVENLSFNQNVHSRNIGEHDQPLVKGEDDVGPMKNLGTTRLQDFISPDEFTS